MDKGKLKQYLAMTEDESIAIMVGEPIGAADPTRLMMADLLSALYCVEILADDLHYRSRGADFYGNHLLADRVKEHIPWDIDGLRETYWLGEKGMNPPRTDESMSAAAENAHTIRQGVLVEDGKSLRECLLAALAMADTKVGEVKASGGFTDGTGAVLDNIAQHITQGMGLVHAAAVG